MTATEEHPAANAVAVPPGALARAEGVELLGPVHGSGYRDGAALVRRADGQIVQLGPLMYALLEAIDGRRSNGEVARAMTEALGRGVGEPHVQRLAEKLAAEGLLAGTEHAAPPRRNPLLALRFKVLVTNPRVTDAITRPFTFLFRPWVMWPVLAAFVAVCWFVLVQKGVASAVAQALNNPGLLLIVFALTVISAGFHELGHAAACRYGGATPGGMGMGLYLVWPAFYTDVTDAYRLDRRSRLRVDLAGLYFNAVVAVVTMAVWLALHVDALLLLVALQLLQMVKQLSPVIRADGYHILSDATGVPDLFAHLGPTLRRLVPGHRREPSALTGWARFLVTVWVLVIVPVLLSLMAGAVLLLPKLMTSAWDSGRHIVAGLPHEVDDGDVIGTLASLLRLVALLLPVVGSVVITQRLVRTLVAKARRWSHGRPGRRVVALLAASVVAAGLAYAWWPSGQYQPVRASEKGTIGTLVRAITSPNSVVRPSAAPPPVALRPGRYLALSMVPVGGATRSDPALFVLTGAKGDPPVAILTDSTPGALDASAASPGAPAGEPSGLSGQGGVTTAGAGSPATTTARPPAAPTAGRGASGATTPAAAPSAPVRAAAFPFKLPAAPGPGGTQALAVGTKSNGVTYKVAYAIVTVTNGAPVTETNSAFALADCQGCTTVAVSFQIVLIVGESRVVAPIDAAGALNYDCPACTTTAIADQMVLTLSAAPSAALQADLEAALEQLNALPELGAGGTPAAVASEVAVVQQEVQSELAGSGLVVGPGATSSPTGVTGASGSTGASGAAGASGATGASGTTGESGAPGTGNASGTGAGGTEPAAATSGASGQSTASGSSAGSPSTTTVPATTTTAASGGASAPAKTSTSTSTPTSTTTATTSPPSTTTPTTSTTTPPTTSSTPASTQQSSATSTTAAS